MKSRSGVSLPRFSWLSGCRRCRQRAARVQICTVLCRWGASFDAQYGTFSGRKRAIFE